MPQGKIRGRTIGGPPKAASGLDPKSGCEIYGPDLGRRHKGRGQRAVQFLVAAGPGNQTGPGNLPNKNSPGAGQNRWAQGFTNRCGPPKAGCQSASTRPPSVKPERKQTAPRGKVN